jgi:hypothetical protein
MPILLSKNPLYFVAFWYIFPALVCCTKKNLATLLPRVCDVRTLCVDESIFSQPVAKSLYLHLNDFQPLTWSTGSISFSTMAGAMMSLTLATAFKTLFPCHLALSLSRSSRAS